MRMADIVRHSPATEDTNANSLTWRVRFNEAVTNVGAADFALAGTTATLAVQHFTGSPTEYYRVTASGGNLASLDATVTLSFAGTQDIEDSAGNALVNTTPAGRNENAYKVDNTAPTVAISGVPATSTAPFTATFTFNEGVRGTLVDGAGEGFTLTGKTDDMVVETSTDAVPDAGAATGTMAGTRAQATRLRLGLEGALPIVLGDGSVLTPGFELGARHDAGDAETGFGADIGAGVALSDPARGLSAELRARGLLTHEAEGLSERGVSGTLTFDPAPETGRGLSLSLPQTIGGQASDGADALLERSTLAGLGAAEDEGLAGGRLETRIGYGFAVLGDRYTATPELGLGVSDAERDVRLGWRIAEQISSGFAFELGVEGTGREYSGPETGAEHGLVAGAGWRLIGRGAESFEVRVEASRRAAANDGASPEHTIGVRLGASW